MITRFNKNPSIDSLDTKGMEIMDWWKDGLEERKIDDYVWITTDSYNQMN